MKDTLQVSVRLISTDEAFEQLFGKKALWTLEETERQLDIMLRRALEGIRLKRKEFNQSVVATNWFDIDPDHPESFPFEVRIHKGTEPLTFIVEICPLPEGVGERSGVCEYCERESKHLRQCSRCMKWNCGDCYNERIRDIIYCLACEEKFGKQTPQVMEVLEPYLYAISNGKLDQVDIQICRGPKPGTFVVKFAPLPEGGLPYDINDFYRVEIFRLIKGRLPKHKCDVLSKDILDKFCLLFKRGEIYMYQIKALKYMNNLITTGVIAPSSQSLTDLIPAWEYE